MSPLVAQDLPMVDSNSEGDNQDELGEPEVHDAGDVEVDDETDDGEQQQDRIAATLERIRLERESSSDSDEGNQDNRNETSSSSSSSQPSSDEDGDDDDFDYVR